MRCEMEDFINGQHLKRVYEKKCEPLMRKYNLRKIELDVLFFLHSDCKYDTAKDIVNQKCLSKAHVSKAVENLAAQGYIIAKADGHDRRCMHLSITAEAKPIVAEMTQLWGDLDMCIYQDISAAERVMFTEILDKIIRNINLILEE